MQINNANSANVPINPLGHAQPANNQGILRDRQQQQVQQTELSQKERKPQQANRLDVDPNAIALLEQQNEQSTQSANASKTAYDAPSKNNNSAVNTYQSVGNLEQRESVKQLLGVDLYA